MKGYTIAKQRQDGSAHHLPFFACAAEGQK
jgi:hypothetical protein